MSSLSANICVADPGAPIKMPASWSGAPTARFQTTPCQATQLVANVSTSPIVIIRGVSAEMPMRLRPVSSEIAKNAM